MNSDSLIRVFIADDYEIIRAGLRTILLNYPDIEIIGEAATSQAVLRQCETMLPDVILMDFTLGMDEGPQVARRLNQRFPTIKVIILTCMFDYWSMQAIIGAQAAGHLIKNATSDQIISAVRRAHYGEPVFAPEVTRYLLRSNLGQERRTENLTEREREVLHRIAKGDTNKEIGQALGLSPYTVKNHVSRLLDKLGAASRAEAAAIALRFQLVQTD